MEPRSAERGNAPGADAGPGRVAIASMEPRSAERGNAASHPPGEGRNDASMEPRSAERGNVQLRGNSQTPKLLQWSHAQPNVETRCRDRFDTEFSGASMEPRSAERGNPAVAGKLLHRVRLQWSHAQPNVETCSSGAWPRKLGWLQWSHAQPNVETPIESVVVFQKLMASMEPRSAERGNRADLSETSLIRECFNGATLSRTWKPLSMGGGI